MHGTTRTRPAVHPAGTGVNAVVWIEPGRAIVVRGAGTGEAASLELPIPSVPTETAPALAEVAHRVADVDRVPCSARTTSGRRWSARIVAIGHHPESIREESNPGPFDEADLVARLRRLA